MHSQKPRIEGWDWGAYGTGVAAPDADGVVVGAGDEEVAAAGDADRVDGVGVSFQRREELPWGRWRWSTVAGCVDANIVALACGMI